MIKKLLMNGAAAAVIAGGSHCLRLGDHIRVYGVADGTTIDASVVRNVNLR